MSTHNIYFRGEIRKILCGYPLLSVAMDMSTVKVVQENAAICFLGYKAVA